MAAPCNGMEARFAVAGSSCSRKATAMKFGIGTDVHEVVA